MRKASLPAFLPEKQRPPLNVIIGALLFLAIALWIALGGIRIGLGHSATAGYYLAIHISTVI